MCLGAVVFGGLGLSTFFFASPFLLGDLTGGVFTGFGLVSFECESFFSLLQPFCLFCGDFFSDRKASSESGTTEQRLVNDRQSLSRMQRRKHFEQENNTSQREKELNYIPKSINILTLTNICLC